MSVDAAVLLSIGSADPTYLTELHSNATSAPHRIDCLWAHINDTASGRILGLETVTATPLEEPLGAIVLSGRIVQDIRVMRGVPVFKRTRVPVYIVLDYLADGYTVEQLLSDYPDLSLADVKAALTYASQLLSIAAGRVSHC